MEFLPLGSLQNGIRKRTVKQWAIRYQMMLDICEGMAFLHSSTKLKRVVMHQDLKSANVLMAMTGGKLRGKIADFGLAFLKEASAMSSVAVKVNGGTKVYQAPELFVANAKFTKVFNPTSSLHPRNAISLQPE
jgi:serine/threonine protein kinase